MSDAMTVRLELAVITSEAKATRLDATDFDRITDALAGHKRISPAPTVKRLLFSLEGITPDLCTTARQRPDVELVGLNRSTRGRDYQYLGLRLVSSSSSTMDSAPSKWCWRFDASRATVFPHPPSNR